MTKLSMSQMIVLHNELADKLGVSHETSFKSAAAARAAIATLESKLNMTEANTTPEAQDAAASAEDNAPATASDNSKYDSRAKRGPNQGVGAYAKTLIVAGQTNAEVLAAVKEQFPNARTTTGCIAYYRNEVVNGSAKRKGGKDPVQLRAKAAELIAEAEALEAKAANAPEATI
jgi:hypothetical protein